MSSISHFSVGLFILLTGCGVPTVPLGPPSTAAESTSALTPGGRFGEHGMVVFGDAGTVYLSHIPMFHKPHDFQAVFTASAKLSSTSPDFAKGFYTFLPEPCSLDDLLLGQLTQLQGKLFKGSFESEEGELLQNVTFTVGKVVLAQQLTAKTTTEPVLSYFALPTNGRVFLLHKIGAAPSFEQLVSVQWQGAAPQAAQLIKVPGHDDALGQRLESGDSNAQLADVVVIETLLGPDFSAPPSDGQP